MASSNNTIDNNQHAASVRQKPKKARKVRYGRKRVFDVPAENLNDSDTEYLPRDAPLWSSLTFNATSNQQEEATGPLGGGGGAGGASSSSVGGAGGGAGGGAVASGPGKPRPSPSPIDREREKFVKTNLGQFEAMKPGKPKKKIIELLKKHFDNMLSELEMEEKKTNPPKKRKLVGQAVVLPQPDRVQRQQPRPASPHLPRHKEKTKNKKREPELATKNDLKKGKKFVLDEKCEKLFRLVRKKKISQKAARMQIDVARSTFSEKYQKWQEDNKKNNNL